MWPFHRHVWSVRVQTYGAPVRGGADRIDTDTANRWAFGVTTVLLTCDCGAIRNETMLGKQEPTHAD